MLRACDCSSRRALRTTAGTVPSQGFEPWLDGSLDHCLYQLDYEGIWMQCEHLFVRCSLLFRREQWNRTILLLDMNQLSAPADLLTITSQSSMLPCWLQCEQELFVPVPLTCFDSCSDYGLRIPPQGCPVHHLYEHDGLQGNPCHHCCQWIRFFAHFHDARSWTQAIRVMDAIACIWRINGISFTFHSRPASRLFPTGCEPVILDDCMWACYAHDVSCRIHSDPCPAVRLSIMIGFMLMLIVKLSNDPREPAFMCNHERIMFSCFIIVGMARIERAISCTRNRRIPIFPSFRMALFSIINIKSPGTIFVPLYGSGTCLCWLFLFYQHCILVLMLDASWNQFAGLNCHSLSFIQ